MCAVFSTVWNVPVPDYSSVSACEFCFVMGIAFCFVSSFFQLHILRVFFVASNGQMRWIYAGRVVA